VIQSPPRRSPNPTVTVFLAFVAGFVAELAMDLFVDYVLKPTSQSQVNAIYTVFSIVLGAIVGGAMLLGRPRHYGLAVVAGLAAVVAGIIGDEVATLIYVLVEDLPLRASTFTRYFKDPRPIFWISNGISFAVATGLTALRVLRVRAAAPQQQQWAPPYGPVSPPRGPGPSYGQPPYEQGQYGQGQYGPPPQGPYGQPSPNPYGPPPQGPYGRPSPPPAQTPGEPRDEPPGTGPYRPPA
jgi:hypothetical protein